MASTRYFNVRLLRHHQIKQEDLWVSDGKIVSPQSKTDLEVNGRGLIMAPGYIDVQINGAFGVDFSTEPQQVDAVALQLLKQGVTAFLPTIISSKKDNYPQLIASLQPRKTLGATILGIHLEGPFFCPEKHGAHSINLLQSVDPSFYGSLDGIRLVSLAPELPGALAFIKALRQKNCLVAAGHTNATYAQMQEGSDAGITLVTHLFNAMAPLQHREPGVAGYALSHSSMFYTLIADGEHVCPEMVNVAWRANPEGLILMTDAMAGMGQKEGSYRLGHQEVEVKGKRATLVGTDRLAGSILSMDVAVRNLRAFTGCTVVEALESASFKPACLLGIQKQKGTLDIGADADLIFLDDELQVVETKMY